MPLACLSPTFAATPISPRLPENSLGIWRSSKGSGFLFMDLGGYRFIPRDLLASIIYFPFSSAVRGTSNRNWQHQPILVASPTISPSESLVLSQIDGAATAAPPASRSRPSVAPSTLSNEAKHMVAKPTRGTEKTIVRLVTDYVTPDFYQYEVLLSIIMD